MKTKKLILLSLISFTIGAQDMPTLLNQEFLDSLPEDIRKDIQDNNTATALDSNETYRPYLYSSKLSDLAILQTNYIFEVWNHSPRQTDSLLSKESDFRGPESSKRPK